MTVFPDPEIQNKILNVIEKHPGLHLSKIAELLHIPVSDVNRYLIHLEARQHIFFTEEKGIKKYYIAPLKVGFQAKKMLETRQIIYNLVLKNPGLHLSKIAELLNMRISLAEYHLLQMEQENRIIASKEGSYYKRYYAKESEIGDHDKRIVGLLRQGIPLKIVLYLLRNPYSRHKDIMDDLKLTTSTLTYHLRKLVESDIVVTPGFGEKGYFIKNRREIIRFLRKYRIYTMVESFKDAWGEP